MPSVVSEHINSEQERISIERVIGGRFDGQYLLVIHDDDSPRGRPGTRAPMLLDAGTADWLSEHLINLPI